MIEFDPTTKDAPIAFAIAVKYVQKHQPEHMQAWVQFDMTTTTTTFCLFSCGGNVSI